MDNFISELKSVANKFAKKTGEIAGISKLKINIANAKSDISACYKSLGELVYKAQKDGDEGASANIQELFDTIDALYEKIDELNETIATIKNEKVCPNCGASNPKSQRFCGGCGQAFDDDNSEYEEDAEV